MSEGSDQRPGCGWWPVAASPAAAKWPRRAANGRGSGAAELCCVGTKGGECLRAPINALVTGGGRRQHRQLPRSGAGGRPTAGVRGRLGSAALAAKAAGVRGLRLTLWLRVVAGGGVASCREVVREGDQRLLFTRGGGLLRWHQRRAGPPASGSGAGPRGGVGDGGSDHGGCGARADCRMRACRTRAFRLPARSGVIPGVVDPDPCRAGGLLPAAVPVLALGGGVCGVRIGTWPGYAARTTVAG